MVLACLSHGSALVVDSSTALDETTGFLMSWPRQGFFQPNRIGRVESSFVTSRGPSGLVVSVGENDALGRLIRQAANQSFGRGLTKVVAMGEAELADS